MKHVLWFGLAVVLSMSSMGCIQMPAAHPRLGGALGAAPPPDPTRVASCKTTRSWHNFWVLAGSVFGGIGGAGGPITALTDDKNAQLDIGIGIGVAGVFALISTTAAGITADTFATDNCEQILQQAPDASASSTR